MTRRDACVFRTGMKARNGNGPYVPLLSPSISIAIRSERLLIEQLDYNLVFRWFVGLNTDDPVWVPTVFRPHRQGQARRAPSS